LISIKDLRGLRKKLNTSQSLKLMGLIMIALAPGLFLFASSSPAKLVVANRTTFPAISPASHTSLAVDGSASGFCNHDTNSCFASLSTSRTNDVLLAYTVEDLNLQTSCIFSVTDSAGLPWASRTGIVFGNGGRDQIQEFWVKSTGVLSSDVITETISGCASVQFGGEYNGVMIFAVSGTDFSNPFDPNSSLPGNANGSGTQASVSVSTSNHSDMIVGATRFGGNTATPGNGFTLVTSMDQGQDAIEYALVHQRANNLPVTFSGSTSNVWLEIADALHSA
jgi:hypothetical protein